MIKRIFLAVLFTLVCGVSTSSAQSERIIGSWVGKLTIHSGQAINVEFSIRPAPHGGLAGTWASPDQSSYPSEMASVVQHGDTANFELGALGASFIGDISKDGSRITGAFIQGMPIPLTLFHAQTFLTTLHDTSSLAPSPNFRFAIKLANDGTNWLGTVEAVDHGEEEYSIGSVLSSGDSLDFIVPHLDGRFEGIYEKGHTKLKGSWVEADVREFAEFSQVKFAPGLIRPQEPRPPYPYKEDTVSYPNTRAGIRLAGTLTVPEGKGPFPAVFLITGSGPQDRDESIMGHKPFKVIADVLTRHGIAVLRTDDRGTAHSGGNFSTADTRDFASDALAAVEFLKTRREIDAHRIGLIGHSEGGMIAPMIAARDTQFYSDPADISFLVLLAGPGVPITELMNEQRRMLTLDTSARARESLAAAAIFDSLVAANNAHPDPRLPHVLDSMWRVAYREEGGDTSNHAVMMQLKSAQLAAYFSPWYRYFLSYDPQQVLNKVHCPVLALNGTLDHQVASGPDLAGIAAALKEASNTDVTIKPMPGLNHLFQHAKTGLVGEYAGLQETFSPEVLKIMTKWIQEHTKK